MNKPSGTEISAGCFILLITIPLGAIFEGYALATLWKWFIVATFAAPVITIPQAIGLSCVAGIFQHPSTKTTEDSEYSEWWSGIVKAIATAVLRPAMYLLFGWIIKQWMQ